MADTRWRTRWRISVGIFVVLAHFVSGYEELYTMTNLSPKSINNDIPYQILETSRLENFEFHIEPSVLPFKDFEKGFKEDFEHKEEEEGHKEAEEKEEHARIARSADRESRSINFEDIPTSNNNEIDNDLENHNKRKYYDILPTKTVDYLHDRDVILPSEGFGDRLDFQFPGEGLRVPKMRALQPSGSQIRPTAVQKAFATITPNGRQNNAEIQNIITGIVKLLNGNVNVQANTQLNRGRPMATRINNRGPPRISDVPPLPDFEKPTFVPTKTPPPYPFDRPQHHINIPEQIVPPSTQPYRPGFHRPSLPPWHRPRPRPTPGRRPTIPIYKTTPRPHEVEVDLSHEKEDEDVLTLNENEDSDVVNEDKINGTSAEITTDVEDAGDKSTTPVTEIKEDNYTKEVTTTTSTTTTTTEATTTEKVTEKTTTTEKATTTEKVTTTTEKLKEKPKIEKKKDKLKVTEEKISNKTKNETTEIESSITEKTAVSITDPTPTEGLPTHVPSVDVLANVTDAKSNIINSTPLPSPPQGIPYHPYRPRPGIVLDDTDFKPHSHRPASVITAPQRPPGYGEIFDVTVSAIQGPGGKGGASVHIQNVNPLSGHPEHDDIIVSPSGDQGFVSIDGKRTYLNLFGDTNTVDNIPIQPTRVQRPTPPTAPPQLGTGIAIPSDEELPQPPPRRPAQPQRPPQHQTFRRPQPPVRIDTCIVGDDSTCDQAQNEKCRTEAGISSCQCRPGYARRSHRDPCRRVLSLVLNMRVDRLYDRKVAWDMKLADKDSEPYQQLSYEAVRAIDSAFSMTPFSDDFVGGSVNTIHRGDQHHQGVFVNYTILMQETAETLRGAVSTEIQKHLLGVIRRRSNNVGASALWVDTPNGSVLPPQDLDECATPDLNDCHKLASCTNTWGGFRCQCPHTTRDSNPGDPTRGGRDCQSCADTHCNDRGTCHYSNGQPYCSCNSGYYGSTCEVDGEVVGVAVGASLAAALVIALTLAALLSWSRKWTREQKAAGMGSPVFSYMAANTIKTPPVGQPPYQVTLEERMRWAQIAEAMAANHYAQQEQVQTMATRPSSAMFGAYPTLPPVPLPRTGLYMGNSHHGTMNTVASRVNTAASHHNLYGYTNHAATESTSSEASSHVQERADLLVPRPKSRARSMHNQNGIYYDVEYENAPEGIYGTKGIPLSTYTVSRGPPFYRT